MEWTVHELARRAGVSRRTLHHYDQIGLLHPDRIGANGYRYYGQPAVARLQRILLLRETGMPLGQIASVLNEADTQLGRHVAALEEHVLQMEQQREALDRRLDAVRATLDAYREGREPSPDVMLEGFNDRYEDEVVARWGRDAFDATHDWWHGKSFEQQRAWKADAEALVAAWRALHAARVRADSRDAQALAARHVEWLRAIPGTPTHAGDRERSIAMIRALGNLYACDPGFVHSLGGPECAAFVRDALLAWTDAGR